LPVLNCQADYVILQRPVILQLHHQANG